MNDNSELINEALLDLAIILKRNNELVNENNELRKKIEEKENDIKRLISKKGNSN